MEHVHIRGVKERNITISDKHMRKEQSQSLTIKSIFFSQSCYFLQSLTHFVSQLPSFVLCYPIITRTEKPDNPLLHFHFTERLQRHGNFK